MNLRFKLSLALVALLVAALGGAQPGYAAPPANGCSLLTPAQIEKVLGQPFGAPAESQAPPAYGKQPWGSHCEYSSQKGAPVRVTFIVYEDASASEAKQTFDKLSVWFVPKSKPAVGDSAYIDADHAIHVLKGRVRFYISISPVNEKQATDLAGSLAARI